MKKNNDEANITIEVYRPDYVAAIKTIAESNLFLAKALLTPAQVDITNCEFKNSDIGVKIVTENISKGTLSDYEPKP